DDSIACLNKAMVFLTAVASSRFPSTNNQLRTSSNTRNQATIQDGGVTVQQVQGRQGKNYSGTTYKGNATRSRGNTTSGQARVVKCYNCQEAQEARQILDEEQLAFLVDPRIPQVKFRIIPHNAAFQTEDLDTYDSNCDDLSNAQAVLMANISNYDSDAISEIPNSDNYLNDMDNQKQMINHVNNWKKANKEQNKESIIDELERYKERVKTFEQRLNIDLSRREKMIDSQMDDMIKENLALKEKLNKLSGYVYPILPLNLLYHMSKWKFPVNYLRTTHNALTEDLLNEITEVKTAFNQMEVAVQQSSVDKQCLEIADKELHLEND
nr:hypothetical protein [Tanacetum cinerariifolium]